jgi:hypothetical protein
MKDSVLKSFARHGVRLAVLFVFLVSVASLARAQAAGGASQPGPKAGAPASVSQASASRKIVLAAQAGKPAVQSEPQRGGNHEGIKVHGHWTIEVRNPDGKLISHTEFENALIQPDGVVSLTNLFLGYTVPGGYKVILANGTSGNSGPCAPIDTSISWCILVGSLISPEPAAFGDLATGCGGTGKNQITATGPCFPLSIGAVGFTGIAFSGTAVASTTVSITDVYLDPLSCPETLITTSGPGSATTSPNTCAQSEAGTVNGLTHATLPTPVTISAAGQLISVNVQLTFQ